MPLETIKNGTKAIHIQKEKDDQLKILVILVCIGAPAAIRTRGLRIRSPLYFLIMLLILLKLTSCNK